MVALTGFTNRLVTAPQFWCVRVVLSAVVGYDVLITDAIRRVTN